MSYVVCRLALTRVYRDKIAEARIMQFHYKVALYHSYLPIKIDDGIQGGPLIWGLKTSGIVCQKIAKRIV